MRVQGIDQGIYSDPDVGDYHRMLLPGTYTLVFVAAGYDTVQESDVAVTSGSATVLDVQMNSNGVNDAPFEPSSPSPADGAVDQSVALDLGWSGGDPDSSDVVTYSVYLDTMDPPVTLVDTVEEPGSAITIEYQPGSLAADTTYYWQIVAEDDHGGFHERACLAVFNRPGRDALLYRHGFLLKSRK